MNDSFFAISPIDGRYSNITQQLSPFLSESALIRNRIAIETNYLLALSKYKVIRPLTKKEIHYLTHLNESLSTEDIVSIKQREETYRHDVKAVEYTLAEWLSNTSLKNLTYAIHLGLTSEDINNIAYRLMLKNATTQVLIPIVKELIQELIRMANTYKSQPMLARTHGQPAVPTTLGKELVVFTHRLAKEYKKLVFQPLTGKLNGAVGNYNALSLSYPHIDWIDFTTYFISSLDLTPSLITTQINTPEDIIEFHQTYLRINGIILNLNQDLWRYISDDWFSQKNVEHEIGSSVMPQKINPIYFENSEGNLILANGLLETINKQLSVSRLQRDLSGSTVMRNMSSALGYCLIAYTNTKEGLKRIEANKKQIEESLSHNWTILGEGLQTYIRSLQIEHAYEQVAQNIKGQVFNQHEWHDLIKKLPLTQQQQKSMTDVTPSNYIGNAVKLTEMAIKEINQILTIDRHTTQ